MCFKLIDGAQCVHNVCDLASMCVIWSHLGVICSQSVTICSHELSWALISGILGIIGFFQFSEKGHFQPFLGLKSLTFFPKFWNRWTKVCGKKIFLRKKFSSRILKFFWCLKSREKNRNNGERIGKFAPTSLEIGGTPLPFPKLSIVVTPFYPSPPPFWKKNFFCRKNFFSRISKILFALSMRV